MEEILIDIRKQNEWIKKIFDNKDLVSLEYIFATIEEMDSDIENLKAEISSLNEKINELTYN